MKLCKDCKFSFVKPDPDPACKSIPLCKHQKSIITTDYYSGEHTYSTCQEMRLRHTLCSDEAVLFEGKDSLIKLNLFNL